MDPSNYKQQASELPRSAYSFKELAQSWGISERTLRAEKKAGRLPYVQIGRRVLVTKEQAEQYLARRAVI